MSDEGEEHEGGGERWLVSYADFITLLMVLFVVLYSMGQTDVKRYKALAEGLTTAFGGTVKVVDTGISQTGSGSGSSDPNPVAVAGFPQRQSDSLDVATHLTAMLDQAGLANGISVQNNIEGLMLSLSEELLFQPSSADLIPGAYPVLDKIAAMLSQITNEVRVTAYTDDTPPTDPRFPTNWELSSARASALVRYLTQHGVAASRLSAVGRGEFHPLFPNDTPEHRAFNRRAEVAVVYTIEQQSFALGSNSSLEQLGTPTPSAGGATQ